MVYFQTKKSENKYDLRCINSKVHCYTALWEYKGGQEDIHKTSEKLHRKPRTEKYIRFTYRFYLGLSIV